MQLDKELLYRFFSHRTTLEEEQKIRHWLEASDENRREFFRERRLFDAILLRTSPSGATHTGTRRRTLLRRTLLAATGMAAIFLLALSTAYYLLQRSAANLPPNTISVPKGQGVSLTLADGTRVWLNAMTQMQYPQSFKGADRRQVHIDGEAYFEVSPDRKHPFVVSTGKGNIEVLGTKFYVSAYSRTEQFETSLVEGRVRVSTPTSALTLYPQDKAVLQNNGQLQRQRIADMDVYRWTQGLYCFKDQPLDQVLRQFELYYDVRFVRAPGMQLNPTISGKFRLVDGVEYALRVLQRDIPFSFRRSEESNIIYIE